jgi:ribonuclease P protein component
MPPRVGFVVPAGVGGAVTRNHIKRRLRALVAARMDLLPDGTDVVVRANPDAARVPFGELGVELDRHLRRSLATATAALSTAGVGGSR